MKKILAIAVATAISAPAMADLTIGGNAEYKLSGGDVDTASSLETNLTLTGTTEADGVTVSAFTEIEVIGANAAGTASDQILADDQFITISANGFTATLAPRGGFATKDAFGTGADTAKQATAVYAGNDAERAADVALDFTAGTVAVQIAGNLSDNEEMSIYASTEVAEGISVAASYEDTGSETGYAFNASAAVAGVTLGANYASNDSDESATVLTASYGDFSIASQSSEGTDDVYGEYATTLGGAALTLAAGSSDSSTKVVAKLAYSF